MLRALVALFFLAFAAAPAASAQAPTDATAWFYIVNNQVQGPYLLGGMQDMAQRGVIRPSTQVHGPGRSWAFAKDTQELQPFLDGAAPPPGAPKPMPPSYPPSYPPEEPVAGPPVVDATRTLEAFLVGHWRTVSHQDMAGRTFETTLEYDFRADGTFGGFMSTSMPDSPGLQPLTEQMRGTWQISALDAQAMVLTLSRGPGMPPDQVALTIVDDATMVAGEGKDRYIRVR